MATYAEMQSQIATDLHRTDLTTDIQTAINRAIDYYERKRTYFNEEEATASTVADQSNYAVPARNAEIDSVFITVSSNTYELERKTIKWIKEATVNTSYTGTPYYFAQHREEIHLYPIPDSVYQLTMQYQERLVDLSATSDTNVWTTNAPSLIEARSKWWINSRILRDAEAAALDKAEELDEWRVIQQETDRQLLSGKVRATDF